MSRIVLDYLNLSETRPPDLVFLGELVNSYTKTVPWESVTRIARRAQMSGLPDPQGFDLYPRRPFEFWRQAIGHGGGGTCFESNHAFFVLLLALGYEGYLTINNMGSSIACHSAIVVKMLDQRWLVDVGFPVYSPLRIDSKKLSKAVSPFHRYTLRPNGDDSYQLERDRHPERTCFTLIDSVVPEDKYRSITAMDYGPDGLFLDRVIITKVIGDAVWRFNSAERPYRLERFKDGYRNEYAIGEHDMGIDNLALALATRFNMQAAEIASSLMIIG